MGQTKYGKFLIKDKSNNEMGYLKVKKLFNVPGATLE